MQATTPVLVGIGTITDHGGGNDPLDLMIRALELAADDAGASGLLGRVDAVMVPRGTWAHPDPGRALADHVGASGARTLVADAGVLQTTLFGRAVDAVRGGARAVVIAGGEAAASAKRAGSTTAPRPSAVTDAGSSPDEVVSPHGMVISGLEIARSFWTPAHQYALIERALGRTPEELDRTWAGWSQVAAANPEAWRREVVTASSLAFGSATNPAVAHPYGRRHCSQMNVDQAAALIVVSVETARSLGIPADRWVFPWAIVESNHMVPVPNRRDVAGSPGFAAVGRRLAQLTGVAPADASLVDLYSCFPSAVEVQRRELGLPADRALTVTGGMSFAGGPFNNYVLQSTARMAQLLRAAPGERGLVTAISGMITKQAGMLWSSEPPGESCVVAEVGEEVAAANPAVPVVGEPDRTAGVATVVTSTLVAGDAPRVWVLGELASGERTLVSSTSSAAVHAFATDTGIGGSIVVAGAEFEPVEGSGPDR